MDHLFSQIEVKLSMDAIGCILEFLTVAEFVILSMVSKVGLEEFVRLKDFVMKQTDDTTNHGHSSNDRSSDGHSTSDSANNIIPEAHIVYLSIQAARSSLEVYLMLFPTPGLMASGHAAALGNMPLLEHLRASSRLNTEWAYKGALLECNMAVLEYLYTECKLALPSYPFSKFIIAGCTAVDRVRSLQWLLSHDHPLEDSIHSYTLIHKRYDVLKWLIEEVYILEDDMHPCYMAGMTNDPVAMQILISGGVPLPRDFVSYVGHSIELMEICMGALDKTIDYAIYARVCARGTVEVLDWLYTKKVPFDSDTEMFVSACMNGKRKNAKWLLNKGVRLPDVVCKGVGVRLSFADQEECPLHRRDMIRMSQWLIKHDCPCGGSLHHV